MIALWEGVCTKIHLWLLRIYNPGKGIEDAENTLSSVESITATDGFQFIGTMNPGGDYGKKELSPALRNRMTEIWCVPPETKDRLHQNIHVVYITVILKHSYINYFSCPRNEITDPKSKIIFYYYYILCIPDERIPDELI